MIRVPEGVPGWGLDWKRAAAKYYLRSFSISVHGSSYAQAGNCLDLDPAYRDQFGRPMLRMTFDFPQNDLKMAQYCTDRAAEIARAMAPPRSIPSRAPAPTASCPIRPRTMSAER
jgi:gluconate 2-dehydrogenase alpha chain